MKTRSKLSLGLAALALVLSVGGCGGGGGGGGEHDPVDPPTAGPPDSAEQSEAGMVAYVTSVANTPDESAPAEPVVLDDFTPPTSSETGEPVPTSGDDA